MHLFVFAGTNFLFSLSDTAHRTNIIHYTCEQRNIIRIISNGWLLIRRKRQTREKLPLEIYPLSYCESVCVGPAYDDPIS